MSLWKCNACGGTYSDIGLDGAIYMHACAPGPPDAHGAQAELPNKRNENVVVGVGGLALDIVAPGAGVMPMQGQPTSEPEWIIKLRADSAALQGM